jgi:hypothetical protein
LAIKNIIDFRGGYANSLPQELMEENMLSKAENCTWKNGVVKRNGISIYDATDLSAMAGLKGMIRAYINDTWYTIIALDDDTNCRIYAGTTTTFAEIDNSFTLTKATDFEFAELLGHVVGVNGTDKPFVIYWGGAALAIEDLELHDIRTRANENWYAGQWDADGADSYFVDDTTDAQSSTADDFQLGNTTANDGFYVSGDYTFNRIVFTNAQAAGGAPVAEYMYWNGTTWVTLGTLVTTPDWTAAEGDKTLEFNLPLDTDGSLLWERYGVDDETDGIQNRFIIRVRFTTAASGAFSCDTLALYNTQYLTQVLQNERPHLVRMHNSQIYLASKNIVNFSPPYYVTGWREGQAEHFDEGGAKITDMVSFADTLVVGKEQALYTFNTSNLMDPVRSRPLTTVGPIASRSMKQIGNIVTFVARDGLYLWDGAMVSKISKHIQEDIDTWTMTDAASVVYKNECWISFPTNGYVLVFDPDTYRTDDAGDGRVSFWKFTGYTVHQWAYCGGAGDTGYLLAAVDQASPYVARCDYGTQDNLGTAANIDMRAQTKYISFGNFQTPHLFGRMKVKVKEVSGRAGKRHKLNVYRDDDTEHINEMFDVPKGSGYYTEELRMPYNIDGKSISVELRHNGSTLATFIGFSLDVAERSY